MKISVFICLIFLYGTKIYSLSPQEMHLIAEKIWKNECAGKVSGLTCWNKGENFGSFGIGHFIWYPEGEEVLFEETFPELLVYMETLGVNIPREIKSKKKCPWVCREQFYKQISSQEMEQLRQFLYETKDYQAKFIAERLNKTLPLMLENLSSSEKEHVKKNFNRLSNDSKGLYALIDYLNFKGSGISPKEAYKGQRWGLLQVLQKIPADSKNVVNDFVDAATFVLTKRVENAPPERKEDVWLKGWLNRLQTYTRSN